MPKLFGGWCCEFVLLQLLKPLRNKTKSVAQRFSRGFNLGLKFGAALVLLPVLSASSRPLRLNRCHNCVCGGAFSNPTIAVATVGHCLWNAAVRSAAD
jgi:hypothetical protein